MKDDGIVILSKPKGPVCGGTDATLDTRAPKVIRSDDMLFFDARSDLGNAPLGAVAAFAAPAKAGYFLFLSTGRWPTSAWALVKESPFPALTALVKELDLARDNGRHVFTHGLPEDFGGRLDIRFGSGERISLSDNQFPVLTPAAGEAIAALFRAAMAGAPAPLPRIDEVQAIRFEETRSGGGFTRATLTLRPDGSGVNAKQLRFDDPRVIESETPVDAAAVAELKGLIANCGMLAWEGLPLKNSDATPTRTLTFALADRQIVLPDRQEVPDPLSHGFFDLQLALTTQF